MIYTYMRFTCRIYNYWHLHTQHLSKPFFLVLTHCNFNQSICNTIFFKCETSYCCKFLENILSQYSRFFLITEKEIFWVSFTIPDCWTQPNHKMIFFFAIDKFLQDCHHLLLNTSWDAHNWCSNRKFKKTNNDLYPK